MDQIQILQEEINKALSGNIVYDTYNKQWRYLLESYIGGEEYRRANHLVRYQLETDGEYAARLKTTPLQNHCASVISVYNSFLFREPPQREFGTLEDTVELESFLEDADFEGRSFDAFMKEASTWASVFGHAWIVLAKANIQAVTLAEERAQGIRPYASLLTPMVVLDWKYRRKLNGEYVLSYFKYIEDVQGDVSTVKEWTESDIRTRVIDSKQKDIVEDTVEINQLNKIPAICVYNKRGAIRGIGVSDIADIADAQRFIYNATSEIDQSIRMDTHPSLVTTSETKVGTGSGALIHMSDSLDPGLKPYLLEFSGASVDKILATIEATVESIDKMANTGAARATESRTLSGVAMETEFSLLNARISEKAAGIELAEEQLWELFSTYQGVEWSGEISYSRSYNIRDTASEITQLQTAKNTATDPVVLRKIDEHILEWMGEEKEYLPFIDPNPQPGRLYPDGEVINSNLPNAYQPASNAEVPEGQNCANCEYYKPGELYCTKFDAPVRAVYWCAKWEPYEEEMSMLTDAVMLEIQDMLMNGMTNTAILAAFPGITVDDIAQAAANAARNN